VLESIYDQGLLLQIVITKHFNYKGIIFTKHLNASGTVCLYISIAVRVGERETCDEFGKSVK
jgi:hypothetical protein